VEQGTNSQSSIAKSHIKGAKKLAVIIKKIKNSIIEAVIEMLSRLNYIPKKKKVFIKPNIAIPTWPSSPYITNPKVVAGVIEYLKSMNIKDIKVGDGPVPIGFGVEETYKVCGYHEMCMERKAELINLDILNRKKISCKENWDFELNLPSLLYDHEYINIAKLKTHYQTGVSLGLKNQKGLLSPEDKNIFHKNLHENIAKLACLVRPELTVIDGTNALEGNGPADMGEEIENLNLLMAGTDFLAADELACHVMGINPAGIKHLELAGKYGLKSLDKEKILGESLEKVKRNFQTPTINWKRGNLYYWWSDYTCSKCSLIEGELIEKLEEIPEETLNKMAPLALITGPPKTKIPLNIDIYGIGKCAAFYCKKNGYKYIDGCPPNKDKIMKFLKNKFFVHKNSETGFRH
jgi:uncharacterized protein (DUF362 family)